MPTTTTGKTLSTGAGIALAGIWLAAAAITITTLILWHFGPALDPKPATSEFWEDAFFPIGVVLIIGWPEMVAWKVTKWILGCEDD